MGASCDSRDRDAGHRPWPIPAPRFFGYRANVAGVLADVVTVTAPTLVDITLPNGGPGDGSTNDPFVGDWDCAWNGAEAGYVERGGAAGPD